eukprot:CAMPEP_0114578224 /NCGR_PEP_ID=MMETSP0125-20121206/2791_1 /TAXON_ID=485358 ORGANISM="Aristerostoma sp., Strain ATCC 50986" /NCGR_SAMPLE_ID=MMETSP0125 /ASSEMBLY_ACC=CAM_ASM_000245 /LENGTH=120 /DNA_ID=CAMNT_0001768135 /DNA_START=237 /DNA_END=599 /DNA_ORIENTATION=+
MAQQVLKANENGDLKDKLKVEAPWFGIFCSAVFDKNLDFTLTTPSVHLIGKKDFTIDEGYILSSMFYNPIVIKHAETHKFPKLNQYDIDAINKYLSNVPEIKREIQKMMALRKKQMRPKL